MFYFRNAGMSLYRRKFITMKYTGTQTEQHHLSNDHARVDLDESFESLATTTSEASEWTPPDIDENNNLDN